MRLGARIVNTKKSSGEGNSGGGDIIINFDVDQILSSIYDDFNQLRDCPVIIFDCEGNVVIRGDDVVS